MLLLIMASTSIAEDRVVWLHSDFPPISIVSGPDKGRGAADQWLQYLIGQLSDFEHETVIANAARVREEMKSRSNACNPAYIKTPEREQSFLFSEPITELLPNGFVSLVSRRGDIEPYLNEKGELKLGELVASEKFRIGVAAGRSFGNAIDQALRDEHGLKSVIPFAAYDIFSSGLIQVGNARGLDAVIGYAIEMRYALGRLNRDPSKYWFAPIAEDTDLVPIHIACSKSLFGERVIARINEAIRTGAAQLADSAYRTWLPPETRSYYDKLRKAP